MFKLTFESISDIPAWLEANPAAGSYDQGRNHRAERDFDGGIGFDGAMQMAREGGFWEKGAEMMMDATSEMSQLKHDEPVIEVDYDVTGQVLDMDEYLSGSPECWENTIEEHSVPVIKIGVQAYTPYGNTQEEFVNRGAAILSCIDDLEAQGFRVELWSCVSGIYRGRGNKHDKTARTEKGIDARTCLKRAEEQWSPSSVAFGLAHAGFGRRLGWAMASASKELQTCGYFPGHYINFDHDRPLDSDFDVWFGYRSMISGDYWSRESALKWVGKEISNQLKDSNYASF